MKYSTPGNRLHKFEIITGRPHGKRYQCGNKNTNTVAQGEIGIFMCEPDAIHRTLKIRIPGEDKILTLCEVYVRGKGTDQLNISTSIST